MSGPYQIWDLFKCGTGRLLIANNCGIQSDKIDGVYISTDLSRHCVPCIFLPAICLFCGRSVQFEYRLIELMFQLIT